MLINFCIISKNGSLTVLLSNSHDFFLCTVSPTEGFLPTFRGKTTNFIEKTHLMYYGISYAKILPGNNYVEFSET